MIGAIIGDIVGSRFEWNNHRSKDFDLFTPECFVTDDSIMTLAIGKALISSKPDWSDLGQQAVRCMQDVGRPYPHCGFGGHFWHWMYSSNPRPYNSFGNGAAMRVSACGFAAKSLEEAKMLSKAVTEVTHNHPEGLKGAEATAVAIYMARTGSPIEKIREVIHREYYSEEFTLDEIRDTYQFNETCQGTVPQALEAFFESIGFEDAIRNAISIGGDSDTLAAITGGVAEAYYGVPEGLVQKALGYLDEDLRALYEECQLQIGKRFIRRVHAVKIERRATSTKGNASERYTGTYESAYEPSSTTKQSSLNVSSGQSIPTEIPGCPYDYSEDIYGYVVCSGRRYKNGRPYDPVEETPAYKAIQREAEELIEQKMDFIRKGAIGYDYYYEQMKQRVLKNVYGIEWSSRVKKNRYNNDAVEDSPEYLAIEQELNEKIRDLIGTSETMTGYCHLYWGTKKYILKKEYGIDWCSPAELTYGVSFD